MGYDADTLTRAMARQESERRRRTDRLNTRRKQIYKQIPELASIDRQLRKTIIGIIQATLRSGKEKPPSLQEIQEKNQALQARRKALLVAGGYSSDALTDKPVCPKCKDSGWIGREMCSCLKKLCMEEQLKELSERLDLEQQRFENFSLKLYSDETWPDEVYSPQENMRSVLGACQLYVEQFEVNWNMHNLLLTGTPGLGKTFLAACMARAMTEKGYGVIYDTAENAFKYFEEQKFFRDTEELQKKIRRYLTCDVLILDGLGNELVTSVVKASLYHILDTRLTRRKSTILLTHLNPDEIKTTYTESIASRLEGEYCTLRFYGRDIRPQNKRNHIP